MLRERAAAVIERTEVQVVMLAVLFMAAYYIPLRALVSTWWTNEDYSYGFLIPLVSAYLLWEKRKALGALPLRSSWGLLPLLVALVLLSLYGILGSSGYVSMPTLPLLIMAFTGFCFGIASLRHLLLPLGFLVFMVPVPPIIERYVGMHLKTISSNLGGAVIGLCNIPVNVSGNIIDLGVTQLQVVDACSGMRYIFPLLALGVLYGYFFERVVWKRVFCVVLTLPLGVLFNALRIGLTGVLTDRFGPKVSQGFFHDFSGWVIFLFAFLMLFLTSRLLSAFFPDRAGRREKDGPQLPAECPLPAGRRTAGALLVSAAILICVGGLSLSTHALPAVLIEGGMESFPLAVGEWQGRTEHIDPFVIERSGAEEAFNGSFTGTSGGEVFLYMGYRSTAFLSNENFFHSPTVCIPSSGWTEREVSRRTITEVPFFQSLEVTKMVIEKGGMRQLVYFWFQTKDKATYSKSINRFHLSLHALRRDNTHDLFIRPITPIAPAESLDDAEQRLDGFVREMMPVLLDFLKEKQVQA